MTTRRPSGRQHNQPHEREDAVVVAAFLVLVIKLSLLIVLFDPLAADVFALPKSAVTHGMSFVLLALLLWAHVRGRLLMPSRVVWLPLAAAAAYLVAMAAASLLATDSTVALFGISRRYLGLTHVADCVVIYLAAVLLLRRPRDLGRLLAALSATAAIAIGYAFVQRLGLDPVTYQYDVFRPISTLGQPDIAGAFLSLLAITQIGVAFWMGTGKDRTMGQRAIALILMALAFVALWAALLTQVRSVALTALGGWVALVIVLIGTKPSQRRLGVSLAAAGLAAIVIFPFSPAAYRFTPAYLARDTSAQGRLLIWHTALEIAAAHPALGVGPDNFGVAYPPMRDRRTLDVDGVGQLQNSTHDWLLYSLTSGGVLATAALLLLAATSFLLGLRLVRRRAWAAAATVTLVAYLAQGLVNVSDVGLDWIFWLSTGIIAAGVSDPTAPPSARVSTSRSRNWLGATVVLVAMVAAVLTAAPRILASEALGRVQVLAVAARGTDAVEQARLAIALDGRRPEYWAGFGVALQSAGSTSAAAVAFKDAVARAPWDPLYWRYLAATRSVSGDTTGAIAAAKGAIQADPYDVESRNLLSRLLYNVGDYTGSLDEGQRALAILAVDSRAFEAPIRAALKLQEWPTAESLARSGLRAFPSSPGLRILLAEALLASGRRDEAKAYVEAVLQIDPQNAEALQVKAVIDGH